MLCVRHMMRMRIPSNLLFFTAEPSCSKGVYSRSAGAHCKIVSSVMECAVDGASKNPGGMYNWALLSQYFFSSAIFLAMWSPMEYSTFPDRSHPYLCLGPPHLYCPVFEFFFCGHRVYYSFDWSWYPWQWCSATCGVKRVRLQQIAQVLQASWAVGRLEIIMLQIFAILIFFDFVAIILPIFCYLFSS